MLLNNLRRGLLINIQKPTSVRYASKKVKHKISEKIPVQLLKDHPTLGFAGEIVRVRPAYMRNYLHVNNGACYITKEQGPRIPVVEKARPEKKVDTDPETKEELIEKKNNESNSGAMSLDELSNLFNSLRTSRKSDKKVSTPESESKQAFEASNDEITYTSSELKEAIPRIQTIVLNENVKLPISKQYLSSLIFDISGIQVSTNSIKVVNNMDQKSFLNEINETGEFTWILETPGERTSIRRTLKVQ